MRKGSNKQKEIDLWEKKYTEGKEFLSTVVSGHKKCVDSFEEEVKDAKDADVKAWSEKTLATLKTHLDKANELSSK